MIKKSDSKTRSTVVLGLIYLILMGVFNLLVFIIFKNHTDVFWLSYGFMTIAFVVQIISMILSLKTADAEAAFYGIPLASLSIFYLCAALAVGALFMIFQQASFTLALVIQVLILAAFLILAIISLFARDTVKEVNDSIKEKVVTLKSVRVDIEVLMDSCNDPELKESLKKLSDTIRYSDPMTNETVAGVEQQIMQKVSELRVNIYDNRIVDANLTCTELERLYVERNKKLAISK